MPASTIEIVINGRDNASGVFNSVGNAMQGLGDKVTSAGRNLMGAGAAMSVVSVPLIGIGVAALKTAMDYEASMNMLQATSGATGVEMGKLGALATQLGADMTLPATSAADAATAMAELGRSGMSVNDIMVASRGVMRLAAAGEMEVADAAKITATTLAMFKLGGEDATRVIDLLAGASNKSLADINGMAMSLQMFGTVANMTNMSVENATTGITLLAQAGIAGSDAGTSLKTMMLALMAPTDAAAAKMIEMGFAVRDLGTGAMLPMEQILANFTAATAGMGEAQRDAAMKTIFGQDAIRAASIVMGGGVAAWDAMKTAITAGGEAAALAETKSRGLAGALDGMKSNIETLLLSAMQPFMQTISATGTQMGPLEVIVRQVATAFGNLTTWIQTADPAMVRAGLAILGMVAAAGPLLLILGAVVTAIGTLLSPIGLVIAAIVALSLAWATNFGGIRDATMPIIQGIIAAGATLVAWLQTELPAAIATLRAQWEPVWLAISGAVSTAMAQIQSVISTVMGIINGIIAEHGPAVLAIFENTWNTINTTVTSVVNAISSIIQSVLGIVKTFIETHGTDIKAFLGGAWEQMAVIVDLAVKLIQATIVPIFNAIADFLRDHGTEIQAILSVAWAAIKAAIQIVLDLIQGIIQATLLIIKGDWSGAWTVLKDTASSIWTTIKDTIKVIAEAIAPLLAAIWEAIKAAAIEKWEAIKTAIADKIEAIKQSIITAWENLKADIAQKWEDIKQAIADKIAEILTSILTWLDDVFVAIESFDLQAAATTFFGTILPGIAAKITEALASVATWLSDTFAKIATFDLQGAASTAFSTVLTGLAAKITEALVAVGTWLADTFKAIAAFDLLDAAKTLFKTVVTGIIQTAINIIKEVGIFLSDIARAIARYDFKSDTMKAIQTVIVGIIRKAIDILVEVGVFLTNIANKIREFSLFEEGVALISGLIDGIKSKVGEIMAAVAEIIRNAIAAARAALGNPNSPAPATIPLGTSIVEGLMAGINSQRDALQNTSFALGEDITKGLILGLLGTAKAVLNAVLEIFKGIKAEAAKGAAEVVGAVADIMAALTTIIEAANALIAMTIPEGIVGLVADLMAVVRKIIDEMIKMAKGLKEEGIKAAEAFAKAADAAIGWIGDAIDAFTRLADYNVSIALVEAGMKILTAQIENMVKWLVAASAGFKLAGLPAALAFAEAASAAVGWIGEAIDAFAKLEDYNADFDLYAAGLGRLKDQIINVVAWLVRISTDFDVEAMPAIQAFAATAGAAMGMLSEAIDTFAKLEDYDADFSLYAAGLGRLKDQIVNVVAWLARVAADFEIGAIPAINAFAATAGAAMAVLGGAIDTFEKFQTFDANFDMHAAGLARLKASIVNVVNWLARMAADFDIGALPAVTAFAAAATAAMGVLSSAIDAFTKFQKFATDFDMHAAGLARLKASIVNVVQWLVRMSADFDVGALPAVNAFATAANAAMAVLGNAIAAFTKVQEYDATFNLAAAGLANLKAQIVNCVLWIVRMGEEMSVSGLAGAVAFAAAANAVMVMIGNAVDAFTALATFEGVTVAAVMSFGEAMGTVVAVLAAVGSTFNADGLAAATAFATAAGTIGAAIENAVKGLKTLMEFSGALSDTAINAFQDAVAMMVVHLIEVAGLFDADGLAAAQAFATAAGAIGGAIDNAVKGLKALMDFSGVISWDAMHAFQVAIWTMVAGLREVARGFDAEGLAAAQAFAAAAGAIGASIETALRGIQALLAYAGGNITEAMALFVTDIQAVVTALGAANADLQTGVLAATTFLALVNSILANITSAATAMTRDLAAAGTASSATAATWLAEITAMVSSLVEGKDKLSDAALPAATQVSILGAAIGAAILAGATAAAAGANVGAAGVPGAMAIILASVVAAVAALQAQFVILNAAAWAFGYNWVSNLIAGLNARLPNLVSLLAYIRGLFPSSPAKYGPFRTLPDGQAVGGGFATGLTDGLLGGQSPLLGALGLLRGAMTMNGTGGLQPAYAGGGTNNNTFNFSGPINVRDDRDIERLANAVGDVLARQADINRRSGYRF